jgi:hypothetical protein
LRRRATLRRSSPSSLSSTSAPCARQRAPRAVGGLTLTRAGRGRIGVPDDGPKPPPGRQARDPACADRADRAPGGRADCAAGGLLRDREPVPGVVVVGRDARVPHHGHLPRVHHRRDRGLHDGYRGVGHGRSRPVRGPPHVHDAALHGLRRLPPCRCGAPLLRAVVRPPQRYLIRAPRPTIPPPRPGRRPPASQHRCGASALRALVRLAEAPRAGRCSGATRRRSASCRCQTSRCTRTSAASGARAASTCQRSSSTGRPRRCPRASSCLSCSRSGSRATAPPPSATSRSPSLPSASPSSLSRGAARPVPPARPPPRGSEVCAPRRMQPPGVRAVGSGRGGGGGAHHLRAGPGHAAHSRPVPRSGGGGRRGGFRRCGAFVAGRGLRSRQRQRLRGDLTPVAEKSRKAHRVLRCEESCVCIHISLSSIRLAGGGEEVEGEVRKQKKWW